MKRILAAAGLAFFASQSAAFSASTILGDFTFNITIDKDSTLPGTKTYCSVDTNIFAGGRSISESVQIKATGNKCKVVLPVRWPKEIGGTTVNFSVGVYAFTSAKPHTTLRSFRSALTAKIPTNGGKFTKKYDLRF